MKTFLRVVATILIAGSLGTAEGQVDPGMEPGGEAKTEGTPSGAGLRALLRGVNLTGEQKTKMQEILQSQRSGLQDTYNRMRATQNEIGKRLLSAENLDESQLTTLLEQTLFLQNQLARRSFRTMLDIRNLLTAEQLAQGAKYREQLKAQQKGSEEKTKK
ncbi:MAG: Spy/CpxP family protein refolding chaperone [Candidatus Binatia bacterium]